MIDQYKTSIQNFYVLFLFDELETQYDYHFLYKLHMAEGSIITLDQNDIFTTSKSFVLTEEAYLQNEELFYKFRLQASGEILNKHSPMRTCERFEKALDQLTADKIIAAWHYVNWDEKIASSKEWNKYWLNTTIVIEPSDVVQEHYHSIKKVDKNVT